ncbi:MAG: SIR2 family protein [Acidobacteriota bacterium]
MPEDISENTIDIIKKIETGECTLFLGAGASVSAGAPTGDALSALIIKKLRHRGDWAMSVDQAFSFFLAHHNLLTVEKFIQEKLTDLSPSKVHEMIPWFKWRALVTTNYDQLLEKAFANELGAAQRLIPIVNENDLPKVGYPLEECVPLLKPHGCISDFPRMSLGIEGIHEAKKRRRLMFSYIEMLHLAGPVIYIGYSLRDSHILDMICELKDRLGNRTDMLFVTKQDTSRKAIERQWFERTLRVEYLDWGFEGFMTYISEKLRPAIGPSKIVPQLASCRIITFGNISYKIGRDADGEWECWIDYTIKQRDDYVGIILQTKKDSLDISEYREVSFELNIPSSSPQKDAIEAIKLEGYNRVHSHKIDIRNLTRDKWERITLNLDKFKGGVRALHLRQVVFTDNGNLGLVKQGYKVGIRKVSLQ